MIRRLAWDLWGAFEFTLFPWFLAACLLREGWKAIQGMAIPDMGEA